MSRKNLRLMFGLNTMVDDFAVDTRLLQNLAPICKASAVDSIEMPFPGTADMGDRVGTFGEFMEITGINKASVCMFFGDGMPKPLDAEQEDAAAKLLNESVDFAKAIGAQKVIGPVGYSIGQPGTPDQVTAFLKKVAGHAEQQGVLLCLEYLRKKENQALPQAEVDAIAVVDAVGSPNVKVHYDTFHDFCFGKTPAQTLAAIGKERLGHVHVSGARRVTPGHLDQVDWDSVYEGLQSVGFEGDVTFEAFGPGCRKAIPEIVDEDFPSALSPEVAVPVCRATLEHYGIIAPMIG